MVEDTTATGLGSSTCDSYFACHSFGKARVVFEAPEQCHPHEIRTEIRNLEY